MHGRVHVAYACVDKDRFEFRDEISFKEGECKTQGIPISRIRAKS